MSEVELGRVDGLTQGGEGVVHLGKTAFVTGALPGELVRFERVRARKRHDEARLLGILEPSPARTEARCAHFGVCGGCALQHLSAGGQIEAKQAQLRECLERIARVTPQSWLDPLTGPAWGYRRRARLGARYVPKKGRVLVGFRERAAPYVTDTARCEVLAPPASELIGELAALLTSLDIRTSVPQIELAAGDDATALVLRVLAQPSPGDVARLEAFERAHAIRLYLQPGGLESLRRLRAVPEAPLSYALPEFDVRLEFAPTDFIQVNGPMNRALVAQAVSLLGVTRDSRVLDLFCGLGNFTLALARRAGRVLGVEVDPVLVERARHNGCLNGLGNAEFVAANLAKPLPPQLPWLAERFTHVLLDPPRVGAVEVLRTIARIQPRRVLYISCHPGSLARDLGVLVHEHGFVLRTAGVVDMFAHTTHVESLALLTSGGHRDEAGT